MSMFRFGCGHVTIDPEIHAASWGARLIYNEVMDGSSGVVWDRQTPDGDEELVRSLFPVINEAMQQARLLRWHGLSSDSRNRLCWREGPRLVVCSPQGSYGYLYVTGAVEKLDHIGETKIAEFESSPVETFGNWPLEVLLAKQREELEGKRRQIKNIRDWDLPQAQREMRWAVVDLDKALAAGKAQGTITRAANKIEAKRKEVHATEDRLGQLVGEVESLERDIAAAV